MANVQHTDSGTTDPQLAPPSIGAHYINTVTGQTWVAYGTARVEDWGSPLPGHALTVPDTVNELVLNPRQPITVWRVKPGTFNPIVVLPEITEPGFYEILLVLENSSGVPVTVDVVAGFNQANLERMDPSLGVAVSSATTYKIHCWVPLVAVGGSNFWSVVQRSYMAFGSDYVKLSNPSSLRISGSARKWALEFTSPRQLDLILTAIGNSMRMDPIEDIELLILNYSGGLITMTVDTDVGYPLKDVDQIVVQPNSGKRYTLTLCRDRWSVAKVQDV